MVQGNEGMEESMNAILAFDQERKKVLAEQEAKLLQLAQKLWDLIPDGFDGYKAQHWFEGVATLANQLNSAITNYNNRKESMCRDSIGREISEEMFLYVFWIELKENELEDYGFLTLEDAKEKLQKLADAWADYFVGSPVIWEGDGEVCLALEFKE